MHLSDMIKMSKRVKCAINRNNFLSFREIGIKQKDFPSGITKSWDS